MKTQVISFTVQTNASNPHRIAELVEATAWEHLHNLARDFDSAPEGSATHKIRVRVEFNQQAETLAGLPSAEQKVVVQQAFQELLNPVLSRHGSAIAVAELLPNWGNRPGNQDEFITAKVA